MKTENPFLSEAELAAEINEHRLCGKALAIFLPQFKREMYFFFQIRCRNLL